MPGVVPVERVVAKTADVAVYISGFWVYPIGFETQLRVSVRDEESDLDPFSFDYEDPDDGPGQIPAGKLRIGFEFADGSKVTNTGRDYSVEWVSGPLPTAPKMSGVNVRGGGAGSAKIADGFWVWPLLPEGGLTFVCEWPAAEIPLTRVQFAARPLIEASQRAQELLHE